MPWESRPRTPMPGSIRLVMAEANVVAKPGEGACRNVCTFADWVARAEVRVAELTESVPSLFRFTPRLARLVMPLLPEMEVVSAERTVDLASGRRHQIRAGCR